MGIAKFIGKYVAETATNLVSGATEAVINITGDIAQNATSKVLNVSSDIHKNKLEKSNLNSQLTEEKLIKLKSLFDKGILNETEFETEKAKVLNNF